MIDSIGLKLLPVDDPDDPLWLVPPSSLDAPRLAGPLSKDRREDLQVYSFLSAVAHAGGRHPLGVRKPEAEPPDRILMATDREWALELTELTIQDVRGELAPVRTFGRKLAITLGSDAAWAHLRGRQVTLSYSTERGVFPKDQDSLLAAIADALRDDRGCFGDGIDFADGPPETWPNKAGLYGAHGPFAVNVQAGGIEGQIGVAASAQAQIRRSEAIAALQARISAKDDPRNELLLITCGLPDALGYTCPLDTFIYDFLVKEIAAGQVPFDAKHLIGFAIHLWDTTDWAFIHKDAGSSPPWVS